MSQGSTDRKEDPDEDDLDDVDRSPPSRVVAASNPPRRRGPIVAIVAVAAIAVVATVVFVVSGSSGKSPKKPSANATPKQTAGYVSFTDPNAGFTLTYPGSWTNAHPTDPTVPLQMDFGPTVAYDSMRVRVEPMAANVNTSNVSDLKAFTNAIISGANVTVLQQETFSKDGLLGYEYFYTLPPSTIQPELVHSHFFIFPAHEMVEVVFQTTTQDFTALAPTFDKVWASFQTTPAKP